MIGSRKSWVMVVATMLSLVALVAAAGASAQSRGGLDRSYGQGGVVSATVSAAPPGYVSHTLFAGAPDGSAYRLDAFRNCTAASCSSVAALYRWAPGGAFDSSFGGKGFVQASTPVSFALEPGSFGEALAVDSRGRPLVSRIESGHLVVRRFTPAGRPDLSFGSGGSTSLSCGDCERAQVWLLPAAKGRVVVEVQNTLPAPEGGLGTGLGGQVTLTRLTAGGRPEKSFGKGGTTTIELGLRGYPGKAAVMPGGGVLLGAASCCNGSVAYLIRVSAKGKVDTKFGRAAGRSLARLSRQGETAEVVALLPRADGTIELVGNDLVRAGFDLRLQANGERARFGKGGLKTFPFRVEAAARGAGGAIFAIGRPGTGPEFAYRLLGDGSVDPAFGGAGIEVPLSGFGYTLGTPSRGKVLVFDAGLHECRGTCPATPGIARFSEGSAKG